MSDPTPWIVANDTGDVRKHAPATLRNRAAIAELLAGILPRSGVVLEIASGSGEHVAHFAQRFEPIEWQPSDPEPAARASIAAWCDGMANVAPPLDLDAAAPNWPIARADAVLCINMVHISPWDATEGLMGGCGLILDRDSPLVLYGPFSREALPTAPSNLDFDASLRGRDPRWGLRSVESVTSAAGTSGLRFDQLVEMPANNLMLVYRRD